MCVRTQTVQKVLVYSSWGQLSALGTEAEAVSRYKVGFSLSGMYHWELGADGDLSGVLSPPSSPEAWSLRKGGRKGPHLSYLTLLGLITQQVAQ